MITTKAANFSVTIAIILITVPFFNYGQNVGIGTTAPEGVLHVQRAGNGTDAISEGIGLHKTGGGDYAIQITSPGGNPHIDFANGLNEDSDARIALTGDDALFIDGANVGIGNATPTAKLDVNGNVRINDNALYLRTGGDVNHGLQHSTNFGGITMDGPALYGWSAGVLATTQGGTQNVLVWRDNGRVGIGTATPAQKLHVGAADGEGIRIGTPDDPMGNDGGSYAIEFYGYRDVIANAISAKITAERTDLCCGGTPYVSQGTDLAFYTVGELTSPNADNSLERMRIKDNGNVGIGTAAPSAQLHTTGTVRLQNLGGAGNQMVVTDNDGNLSSQAIPAGADNLGNHQANQNLFINNNTVLLRSDLFHGLRYSNNYAGVALDGPVLFGFNSGVLGTSAGIPGRAVLYWNSAGRVGIGTGTPAARLHVDMGTEDGEGVQFTGTFDGTNGTVPDLGAGSRMMFYPAKGAFRAGVVTGTQWDDANTGTNSTAWGRDVTASGLGATAWGSNSEANAEFSTAWGNNATASGNFSFAWGSNTTATGLISTAWGASSTATETGATAWGASADATQAFATAWGRNTTASGQYSTAWGDATTASGFASTAFGSDIEARGNQSVGIGLGGSSNIITQANTMAIMGGRVGIGTVAPEAPLDVRGSVNSTETYHFLNGAGIGGPATFAQDYSIRAEQAVLASEFNAFSDRRIKNINSRLSSSEALENIMALKPTHYHYIDSIQKGTSQKTGFIAQEVKAVLPEAVTDNQKRFIPSVYALANDVAYNTANQMLTVTLPKAHDLAVGDSVRFITQDGEATALVAALGENNRVAFEGFLGGTAAAELSSLFVFGKWVTDFHTVDYDHLYTQGIGAIQELANRLMKTEQRLLKAEQSDTEMNARIDRLEALLEAQASK